MKRITSVITAANAMSKKDPYNPIEEGIKRRMSTSIRQRAASRAASRVSQLYPLVDKLLTDADQVQYQPPFAATVPQKWQPPPVEELVSREPFVRFKYDQYRQVKDTLNHRTIPTRATGFSAIVWLHQLCCLSYFGYNSDTLVKTLTLVVTILFILFNALVHTPCFLNCMYDMETIFSNGITRDILLFVANYMKLFLILTVELEMVLRGGYLRYVLKKLEQYSDMYDVGLTLKHAKRLKQLVFLLIFIVVGDAIGGILMIWFHDDRRLYRKTTPNGNKKWDLISAGKEYIWTYSPYGIDMSDSTYKVISAVFKLLGSIQLSATECFVCYISLLMFYQVKQLHAKFDKIKVDIDSASLHRSLEEERFSFIELHKIIQLLDNGCANLQFISVLYNFTNTLIAICILIDTMSKSGSLYVVNWVDFYTICSSLLALYLMSTFGALLSREFNNLVEFISDLNIDLIDASNYRSVSNS